MRKLKVSNIFLIIFFCSSYLFADVIQDAVAIFTSASVLQIETVNQVFINMEAVNLQKGIWLKPYISNERLNLGQSSQDSYIRNYLIFALLGLDLSIGDNEFLSIYFGFDRSNQTFIFNSESYEKNISHQSGILIGLAWMKIKKRYYIGLTANLWYNNIMPEYIDYNYYDCYSQNRGSDIWTIATKLGYNLSIGKNWLFEPNLTLLLGMKNLSKMEGSTSGESIAMLEPQLKIKRNFLNVWQVYGFLEAIIHANSNNTYSYLEYEFNTSLRYGKIGVGLNNNCIGKHWGFYTEATTKILTGSTNFSLALGIKYFFNDNRKKELRKRTIIKKIEQRRKAKLKLLKKQEKKEKEKQKRIEKEEKKKQRILEIQQRIEENYN